MCSCGKITGEGNEDATGMINVEKGITNVTITIPASFFNEETDYEKIKTEAEEKGYKSCTISSDGSVTYVIPKSIYNSLTHCELHVILN